MQRRPLLNIVHYHTILYYETVMHIPKIEMESHKIEISSRHLSKHTHRHDQDASNSLPYV